MRGVGASCGRVLLILATLLPGGCVATKAWLHEAEKAREPVPLVAVSATARDGGRIVQVLLEDEGGEASWYRAYAEQTPVRIDEEDVHAGPSVPVVSSSPGAPGTAAVIAPDLPAPAPTLRSVFADGTSTTLDVPLRRSEGWSRFMYALTPLVAVGEAVLFPVLGPAYVVALLLRTPVR